MIQKKFKKGAKMMTNQLQVFNNEDFGEIRTAGT